MSLPKSYRLNRAAAGLGLMRTEQTVYEQLNDWDLMPDEELQALTNDASRSAQIQVADWMSRNAESDFEPMDQAYNGLSKVMGLTGNPASDSQILKERQKTIQTRRAERSPDDGYRRRGNQPTILRENQAEPVSRVDSEVLSRGERRLEDGRVVDRSFSGFMEDFGTGIGISANRSITGLGQAIIDRSPDEWDGGDTAKDNPIKRAVDSLPDPVKNFLFPRRGEDGEVARPAIRTREERLQELEEARAWANEQEENLNFAGTTVGTIQQGLISLLSSATLLTAIGRSYEESMQQSMELNGKPVSEFTDQERAAAEAKAITYSVTMGALERGAFGAVFRKLPKRDLLKGKGRLQGRVWSKMFRNTAGRMATAALVEGTQESIAGQTLDTLANIFEGAGFEYFSVDNAAKRIEEFWVGATVGGIARGGFEGVGRAARSAGDSRARQKFLPNQTEVLRQGLPEIGKEGGVPSQFYNERGLIDEDLLRKIFQRNMLLARRQELQKKEEEGQALTEEEQAEMKTLEESVLAKSAEIYSRATELLDADLETLNSRPPKEGVPATENTVRGLRIKQKIFNRLDPMEGATESDWKFIGENFSDQQIEAMVRQRFGGNNEELVYIAQMAARGDKDAQDRYVELTTIRKDEESQLEREAREAEEESGVLEGLSEEDLNEANNLTTGDVILQMADVLQGNLSEGRLIELEDGSPPTVEELLASNPAQREQIIANIDASLKSQGYKGLWTGEGPAPEGYMTPGEVLTTGQNRENLDPNSLLWKDVSKVYFADPNTDPLTLIEEISEGYTKWSLDNGRVTLAQLRQWLTDLAEMEGKTYDQNASREQIIEDFSKAAKAWVVSRRQDADMAETLPRGFRLWVARFRRYLTEVLKKAAVFKRLREDGALDPELESFLEEASGLQNMSGRSLLRSPRPQVGSSSESDSTPSPEPDSTPSPEPDTNRVAEVYQELEDNLARQDKLFKTIQKQKGRGRRDSERELQKLKRQETLLWQEVGLLPKELITFQAIPMSARNLLYGATGDAGAKAFQKRIEKQTGKKPTELNNKDVAQGLMEMANDFWSSFSPERKGIIKINSEETATAAEREAILENAVAEFKAALASSGKNAANWYSTEMTKAMAYASTLYPELKSREAAEKIPAFANAKDPVAAADLTFRMAMAITSQNLGVTQNAEGADYQFQYFLKNGKFDINHKHGGKAEAISGNLELANIAIRKFGFDGLRKFIGTTYTARELKKEFQEVTGKKINYSGFLDDEVQGAAIFGPKIGQGFLQNLMGNFHPVTVDLWMRRTFGRWTGAVVENVQPSQLGRLVHSMEAAGMKLPDFLKDQKYRKVEGENSVEYVAYDGLADRLELDDPKNKAGLQELLDFSKTVAKKWDAVYQIISNPLPKDDVTKLKTLLNRPLTKKEKQEGVTKEDLLWEAVTEVADQIKAEQEAYFDKVDAEVKRLRAERNAQIKRDLEAFVVEARAKDEAEGKERRLKAEIEKEFNKKVKKPPPIKAPPKNQQLIDFYREKGWANKNKTKGSGRTPSPLPKKGHELPKVGDYKPEWAKAAIVIGNSLGPVDIPSNQERRFIQKLVEDMNERLHRQGYNPTNADIQAVLWYPEKELWGKLANRSADSLNESYGEVFLRFAQKAGLEKEALAAGEAAIQAEQDRDQRSQRDRPAPDNGAEGEVSGQPDEEGQRAVPTAGVAAVRRDQKAIDRILSEGMPSENVESLLRMEGELLRDRKNLSRRKIEDNQLNRLAVIDSEIERLEQPSPAENRLDNAELDGNVDEAKMQELEAAAKVARRERDRAINILIEARSRGEKSADEAILLKDEYDALLGSYSAMRRAINTERTRARRAQQKLASMADRLLNQLLDEQDRRQEDRQAAREQRESAVARVRAQRDRKVEEEKAKKDRANQRTADARARGDERVQDQRDKRKAAADRARERQRDAVDKQKEKTAQAREETSKVREDRDKKLSQEQERRRRAVEAEKDVRRRTLENFRALQRLVEGLPAPVRKKVDLPSVAKILNRSTEEAQIKAMIAATQQIRSALLNYRYQQIRTELRSTLKPFLKDKNKTKLNERMGPDNRATMEVIAKLAHGKSLEEIKIPDELSPEARKKVAMAVSRRAGKDEETIEADGRAAEESAYDFLDYLEQTWKNALQGPQMRNATELQDLLDMAKQMIRDQKNLVKQFREARKENFQGDADLLADLILGNRPKLGGQGLARRADRGNTFLETIRNWGLDTMSGLRDLATELAPEEGDAMIELLYDPVFRAEESESTKSRNDEDYLRKRMDEIFPEGWYKTLQGWSKHEPFEVHKIKIYPEGAPAKGVPMANEESKELSGLSKMQAISLFNQWRDPSQKKRMREQGINEATITQVEEFIGKRGIQLADLFKELYRVKWAEVSAAHKAAEGVPLVGNQEYGGRIYSDSFRGEQPDTGDLDTNRRGGLSPKNSSLKNRTNTGRMYFRDAMAEYRKYIVQQNHYIAFAQPAKRLAYIMKDPKVRNAIIQKKGPDYYRKLIDPKSGVISQTITSSMSVTLVDKELNTIRHWSSIGILSLNIPSAIKQLTSIPAFFYKGIIPQKEYNRQARELFMGFVRGDPEARQIIKDVLNSDYLQNRMRGSFSPTVREVLKRDLDSISALREGGGWYQRLMFLTKAMDQAAIGIGGAPIYAAKYRAALANGATEAEAKEEANFALGKSAENTQQPSNISGLSTWQRSGGFARLFTQFMTSPIQYQTRVAIGIKNAYQGFFDKDLTKEQRKKLLKSAAIDVIKYQVILPQIFAASSNLLTGLFGDDEDREQWLRKHLSALIYGNVMAYPLFGGMVETGVKALTGVKYGDYEIMGQDIPESALPPTLELLGKAVDATVTIGDLDRHFLTDGKWDFGKTMDWIGTVGAPAPLPIQSVADMVTGIEDTITRSEQYNIVQMVMAWLGFNPDSLRVDPEE